MRYNESKCKNLTRKKALRQAVQLTDKLSRLAIKKEDSELIIHSINAWLQLGNYAEDVEANEHDITSMPIPVGFQMSDMDEEEFEPEDDEEEYEPEEIIYPETEEDAT